MSGMQHTNPDMQPSDEQALVRELALWQHAYYEKCYDFAAKELADHARWLTASLLGVNGAAAISQIGRIADSQSSKVAALCFFLGVLAAMLSGYFLQLFYQQSGKPTYRLAEYHLKVSVTKQHESEKLASLVEALNLSQRFAWLAPSLGWVSGICFAAGAFMLL